MQFKAKNEKGHYLNILIPLKKEKFLQPLPEVEKSKLHASGSKNSSNATRPIPIYTISLHLFKKPTGNFKKLPRLGRMHSSLTLGTLRHVLVLRTFFWALENRNQALEHFTKVAEENPKVCRRTFRYGESPFFNRTKRIKPKTRWKQRCKSTQNSKKLWTFKAN